jgi:hypothetical protein
MGDQFYEVLINPPVSFPSKCVMNSVSIKSPIESLMVSPMILTHQVVEYMINLTEGIFLS